MFVALFDDLKSYNSSIFKGDIMAGFTVSIMAIPQGMAYAQLAGMPLIYGLYAALIPLILYPLLGSSRFLSVGPVALVSIIMVSALSPIAEIGSQAFIDLTLWVAIIAGLIQIVFYLLRMGFLVNFLSHPVLSGFTSAAAFIIAISQLKYFLGISSKPSFSVISMLKDVFTNIANINLISLAIGVTSLALILIFKKIKKTFPSAIFVVIIGILATYMLSLDQYGVDIVGRIPSGMPTLHIPIFDNSKMTQIVSLALVISLISFIESLSISKSLALKNNQMDINANQELLALGVAKFVGGFFQAFPNTGSFTRSAVNEQAGAKTGLSSILAASILVLTLLFFTSYLYYLPKAVLAAVVISAVFSLINIQEARHLLKSDKRDFTSLLATFVITLFFGIQLGVVAGILISIFLLVERISHSKLTLLGRNPETSHFRNIERFQNAEQIPGIVIARFDGDIFFGNADHFYQAIIKALDQRPDTKKLILNLTAWQHPDSSGMTKISQLIDYCNSKSIKLILTDMRGPVRDRLQRNDLIEKLGSDAVYYSVEEAVKNENLDK